MLYWKSTCTTCREIRAALRARMPALPEKNYSKDPLTVDEIRAMIRAAGVPTLLNTTHAICKERGWKANPPDAETFAIEANKEPNLLRRPILLIGEQAWVHKACLDAPLPVGSA